MRNFLEFTWPGNSRDQQRDVSGNVTYHIRECHVRDTFIAVCQEKSWSPYVTCCVSREVRTLIFNGARGSLFKQAN